LFVSWLSKSRGI